jgi:hypothetical protein
MEGWVGNPGSGQCPASEFNDGPSPENPDYLRIDSMSERIGRGI